MADRFTGFWEDNDGEGNVSTTVGRLRRRLEAVPPGTMVRVDLIAWADE